MVNPAPAPNIPAVAKCYVTVGTFTRRGLSSTAKTLRSLERWFKFIEC